MVRLIVALLIFWFLGTCVSIHTALIIMLGIVSWYTASRVIKGYKKAETFVTYAVIAGKKHKASK